MHNNLNFATCLSNTKIYLFISRWRTYKKSLLKYIALCKAAEIIDCAISRTTFRANIISTALIVEKIRTRGKRKKSGERKKRGQKIMLWKFQAPGEFVLNSGFGSRGVLNPWDGLWNDFMADQRLALDCIRGVQECARKGYRQHVQAGKTTSTVWQRGATGPREFRKRNPNYE